MLTINNIHDKGKAEELLSISVNQDGNLKGHMVVDRTFKDGNPSNKQRHTFVFPDREVKRGEFIRLYTGKGEDKIDKNENGDTIHCFYWGFEGRGVWNTEGDHAIILKYEVEDNLAV